MRKISTSVLTLLLVASAHAGTATYDFSTDPAAAGSKLIIGGNGANTQPYQAAGGNPGGFLAVTYPIGNSFTSVVFPDSDNGQTVKAFKFECDLRIGNSTGDRAADGFSVSYARGNDPILASLPDSASTMGNWAGGIAEGGSTTGIAVDFDTWSGNTLPDGGDIEGIIVRVDNVSVLKYAMPTRHGACDDVTSLQTGPRSAAYWTNGGDPMATDSWKDLCWQHLIVDLDEQGKLTVTYKNKAILDHFQTTYFPSVGRLVLAGRTGGANENTHFDNIKITTVPASLALVSGLTTAPDGFTITLDDSAGSVVDPATIAIKLDGATVTPTSVAKSGVTTSVKYTSPAFLASGSSHDIAISFKDKNGTSVSATRAFNVQQYATVPAEFVVAAGAVDKSKLGFKIRPYVTDENNPNNLAWTEDQLAGKHGPNLADLSGADKDGFYTRDTTVNFDIGGGIGNFQPDDPFPGLPGTGARDGGTGNSAMEILTFLEFSNPGIYVMGVNSDDAFRVSTGRNALDKLSTNLGQFDGGRGAADTLFTIVVSKAGIYPMRLIWENGGGGANLEWFTVNDGTKVLINDKATAGSIKTYREGSTPPYVKSASPAPGARLVPLNTSISLTLVDTATAVQTSSVQLFLNGQQVTATVSKPAGSKETTVSYKPASDLPRALHTVRLVYSDNASPANVVSNEFTFSTEEQFLFTFDDATVWKYNREGLDLGTAWRDVKYDDSKWEKGVGPIGDNADNSEPVPIRTQITRFNDAGDHITTLYVRGHFNFPGTSASGVTLGLTHMVDDGAVFYLNGVEIHRFGLGAGQAFDFSTFFSGHEAAFSGPYDIPAASLVPGDNVFEAEVHQSDGGSSDIVFGAQLTFKISTVADKTPPTVVQASEGTTLDKIQLSFSEAVEIASGQNPANYTVAPAAGGANLTVTSAALNSGTNVVLTTSPRTAGTVYNLTVKDVKDLAGNTVSPNPTTVGVAGKKVLFTFDDSTVWSYNREGKDLGTAWREVKYDDSKWEKGVGPIGDNGDHSEPVPIRTEITRFNDAGDHITTLYVRGHFNFPGTSAAGVTLGLTHMVDDGAVFYLNGVEIHRFGLGAGAAFNFSTFFSGHEAAFSGPYNIPTASLVPGDNVFEAEVHQSDGGSSDIVFGAELVATIPAAPPPTAAGSKFSAPALQGGNLVLTWTGTGTLQSADAVTGPWTDVANAKSPFTATLSGNAKFYRVKQ